MQYGAFAMLYDLLTFDVDYGSIADFLEDRFRVHGVDPSLVLDLACGTGSLTVELARRGYDMLGVDGSADMLAVARAKAAGFDQVLFLEQDMRAFELYGTVDAIVCMLDSINYVTEGLSQVFALVQNYLNPGGLFLFDVNTPYKFQHVLAGQTFCYETEDVFYVWDNALEGDLCRFLLDFFVRRADGAYDRISEEHTERVYDIATLVHLLDEAGLIVLEQLDGFTRQPASAQSERVTLVCGKKL